MHGLHHLRPLNSPWLWLLVAGALLVVGECAAQEPEEEGSNRSQLALQIQEAVEAIQTVRADRRREQDLHSEKVKLLERQVERLQSELEPIQVMAKNEQEELSQLATKIGSDKQTIAAARSWIATTAAALKPTSERTLQRVTRGAGGRRTLRIGGFGSVTKQLSASDTERQASGIADFLQLLGEEWQPARTVTLSNDEILMDGGQRAEHAWVVGFGLAARAFVSEDGRSAGTWANGPAGDWKMDMPAEANQQLLRLLRVVRENDPPALVPLPVYVVPVSPEGTS